MAEEGIPYRIPVERERNLLLNVKGTEALKLTLKDSCMAEAIEVGVSSSEYSHASPGFLDSLVCYCEIYHIVRRAERKKRKET